jgi:hypothetical protein
MTMNVWLCSAALVACQGAPVAVDSVEQAATACRSPMPTFGACYVAECDTDTRTWVAVPADPGTPCQGTGTCDGDGHCVFQPVPPPTAPTNVHFTTRTRTQLGLAWTASTGADSYRVVSSSGVTFNATGPGALFQSLTPSTQYCFTVAADNAGGSVSAPTVCRTTEPPPWDIGLFYYDIYGRWFANGYYQHQPYEDGTLDSLELPPEENDPRLTGLYLRSSYIGDTCDCQTQGYVFLPVGGQVSGQDLVETFGTEHPPLWDANGIGLTISGCATFNDGTIDNYTIFVRENYSTP